MRSQILPCALLLGAIALPALAQPAPPLGPDGLPPGINPVTGARPGNPIGAGVSLPRSDVASNITPGDTRSIIAPNLPAPPVPHPATPLDYLAAAQAALAAGRTGEAQEALERAETRELDRAVPPSRADMPIRDPLIDQIEQARLALASGDIPQAMQLVASAGDFAQHLAAR